ncbi:Cellular morphogenesis protein [Aspergillus sp. HF37]|nr:Cellular morphogenesis protein [Aspergillus sp. HF37]
MPKRKFSDFTPQPREATQATRLAETFDHGVQTLSRALRTARGFERQKLGRREQKAKSEKNHDLLDRVGEEIRALKSLEYHATAEKYLFKQLVKTKRIVESPAFLEFKQKRNIITTGPASAAEANVTARLFKTKPMQNATAGLMAGVRGLLGLEDGLGKPGAGSGGGVAGKEGDVGKNQEKPARPDQGNERIARSQPEGSSEGEEEDEWEGIATDDKDDDDVDYSHFDARLAPSDSDSEAEEANIPPPQHTDTDTDPTSHTPSPPPKKPKTKAKATQPAAPPTSTTFLPSLSMGGYFSGSESESDAEDLDDDAAAPRRKNRMGQQARRALWEKKFGQRANHVKKQKKDENASRDRGWDLRRGATGPEGDRRKTRGKGGVGGGGGDGRMDKMQQRHSAAAPKRNVQEDNKPLHPSWEAKRKSKEQPSTAAFQGKRVVFD